MIDFFLDIIGSTFEILSIHDDMKTKRYSKLTTILHQWGNKLGVTADTSITEDTWSGIIDKNDTHTFSIRLEIKRFKKLHVIAEHYVKEQLKDQRIFKTKDTHLTEKLYHAYGVIEQWKVEHIPKK